MIFSLVLSLITCWGPYSLINDFFWLVHSFSFSLFSFFFFFFIYFGSTFRELFHYYISATLQTSQEHFSSPECFCIYVLPSQVVCLLKFNDIIDGFVDVYFLLHGLFLPTCFKTVS